MFANVIFHFEHSECERMWKITFMIYVHILNGSECFRRSLHSEFERMMTRKFSYYVQQLNVLERFRSNFTFKI